MGSDGDLDPPKTPPHEQVAVSPSLTASPSTAHPQTTQSSTVESTAQLPTTQPSSVGWTAQPPTTQSPTAQSSTVELTTQLLTAQPSIESTAQPSTAQLSTAQLSTAGLSAAELSTVEPTPTLQQPLTAQPSAAQPSVSLLQLQNSNLKRRRTASPYPPTQLTEQPSATQPLTVESTVEPTAEPAVELTAEPLAGQLSTSLMQPQKSSLKRKRTASPYSPKLPTALTQQSIAQMQQPTGQKPPTALIPLQNSKSPMQPTVQQSSTAPTQLQNSNLKRNRIVRPHPPTARQPAAPRQPLTARQPAAALIPFLQNSNLERTANSHLPTAQQALTAPTQLQNSFVRPTARQPAAARQPPTTPTQLQNSNLKRKRTANRHPPTQKSPTTSIQPQNSFMQPTAQQPPTTPMPLQNSFMRPTAEQLLQNLLMQPTDEQPPTTPIQLQNWNLKRKRTANRHPPTQRRRMARHPFLSDSDDDEPSHQITTTSLDHQPTTRMEESQRKSRKSEEQKAETERDAAIHRGESPAAYFVAHYSDSENEHLLSSAKKRRQRGSAKKPNLRKQQQVKAPHTPPNKGPARHIQGFPHEVKPISSAEKAAATPLRNKKLEVERPRKEYEEEIALANRKRRNEDSAGATIQSKKRRYEDGVGRKDVALAASKTLRREQDGARGHLGEEQKESANRRVEHLTKRRADTAVQREAQHETHQAKISAELVAAQNHEAAAAAFREKLKHAPKLNLNPAKKPKSSQKKVASTSFNDGKAVNNDAPINSALDDEVVFTGQKAKAISLHVDEDDAVVASEDQSPFLGPKVDSTATSNGHTKGSGLVNTQATTVYPSDSISQMKNVIPQHPSRPPQDLDLEERRKARDIGSKGAARPKLPRARGQENQANHPANHPAASRTISLISPQGGKRVSIREPQPLNLINDVQSTNAIQAAREAEARAKNDKAEKRLAKKSLSYHSGRIRSNFPEWSDDQVQVEAQKRQDERWQKKWDGQKSSLNFNRRIVSTSQNHLQDEENNLQDEDSPGDENGPIAIDTPPSPKAPAKPRLRTAKSFSNAAFRRASKLQPYDYDFDDSTDPEELDDKPQTVKVRDEQKDPVTSLPLKSGKTKLRYPDIVQFGAQRFTKIWIVMKSLIDGVETVELDMGAYASREGANKEAERFIRSEPQTSCQIKYEKKGLLHGEVYGGESEGKGIRIWVQEELRHLDSLSDAVKEQCRKASRPPTIYLVEKRVETWPHGTQDRIGNPAVMTKVAQVTYDREYANQKAHDYFIQMTQPNKDIEGAYDFWENELTPKVHALLMLANGPAIEGVEMMLELDDDDDNYGMNATPWIRNMVSVSERDINGPLN